MDDNAASAHAAKIYDALMVVEQRHPDSKAVAVLHAALGAAFADYQATHPGVVQPFDGGTPKPTNP